MFARSSDVLFVLSAVRLPVQYRKEHEALINAMTRGASVMECVEAIEAVPRDD